MWWGVGYGVGVVRDGRGMGRGVGVAESGGGDWMFLDGGAGGGWIGMVGYISFAS